MPILFENETVVIAHSIMNDGAMGRSRNPGPYSEKCPKGAYAVNREKFVTSLKLNREKVVMLGLMHGNRVASDEEVQIARRIPRTDAALWHRHEDYNPVLAVAHSDCIAFAIMGPDLLAIGHAGWRGLLSGILENTLNAVFENYTYAPEDLLVFTSPFIQVCHFEVGEDDPEGGVQRYERAGYGHHIVNVGGASHVDLGGIFREKCREMGVPRGNLFLSRECTYCGDCWSARRGNRQGRPTDGRNNITVAAFKD